LILVIIYVIREINEWKTKEDDRMKKQKHVLYLEIFQ
jgi:hypothetical protein